ncbi:hypothetical protein, partial [Methanospirillum sp.]|uniref:hypothetical protein n=1 Tax=Methanospirillum sp. TaxID=45200 RepID=UPI002D1FB70A
MERFVNLLNLNLFLHDKPDYGELSESLKFFYQNYFLLSGQIRNCNTNLTKMIIQRTAGEKHLSAEQLLQLPQKEEN